MWRRRRDDAPRRRRRHAWRMQGRAEAQVALTVPSEYGLSAYDSAEHVPSAYARVPASAGAVPAAGVHQTNGRLGDLMASVFCTTCGEANPEGARYCSRCGTPLVRRASDRGPDTTSTISIGSDFDVDQFDEADADAAAVAALPPGTALLAVRRGPNAGSRFLLDSDLTLVGRHPDSDIFLDDVTVSRRHAEFYRHGGRFTVRDVGSLNGTYVNRERIEEASLNQGDEVQVGKFRLVFLLGPGSASEYGGGMQVGG
jgi:FHA domain-containing protein/zinc ribbon protein